MGRPSKLPSVEEIRELRRAGWTYKAIGEKYDTTPSAVQKKLRAAGVVGRQVSYRDVVPWQVDPKLSSTTIMRHLRTAAKQKAGVQPTPQEADAFEKWMHRLWENQVVLDYHPSMGPNDASPEMGGFFYRSQVPEDEHFYRDPAINKMLAERKKAAARNRRPEQPGVTKV